MSSPNTSAVGRQNPDAIERSDPRTIYQRAASGYDEQFAHALAGEIATTIARASVVKDAPIMVIRTGETLEALATVLATMLTLSPGMDVPSELRKTVDQLARRIRRDVAKAKAEGVADILGAARGGRA